jgi:hypothetical protein
LLYSPTAELWGTGLIIGYSVFLDSLRAKITKVIPRTNHTTPAPTLSFWSMVIAAARKNKMPAINKRMAFLFIGDSFIPFIDYGWMAKYKSGGH